MRVNIVSWAVSGKELINYLNEKKRHLNASRTSSNPTKQYDTSSQRKLHHIITAQYSTRTVKRTTINELLSVSPSIQRDIS